MKKEAVWSDSSFILQPSSFRRLPLTQPVFLSTMALIGLFIPDLPPLSPKEDFVMYRWLSLALLVAAVAVAPVQAGSISGHYLEARTCDVWTGPCFANAEM